MAETPREDAATAAPAGASARPPPEPAGRLRRLVAQLDVQELLLLTTVIALALGLRILKLQPIEYYDDEVSRWHFVREWFHPHDFRHATWTHHMARFGVNLPLYFAQLTFGRAARTYYVWPVVAFVLEALLVYLSARRLGGRAAATLAAIFLCSFSGIDRGASQLLPDAFGGTALIAVYYLMLRYQEADVGRRFGWLIGSALAFVWAYEVKESNLLFLPGAAVAIWLCRGRFRDGVVFGLVLLLAIALETAGFRLFTDYSSRFAIVEEAHGHASAASFWTLFERFTRLEPPWQMLIWMWLPSAFSLAAKPDRRLQALLLLPGSFIFLLTFLVRGIHPIEIWTRFFSRYFEPVAPLLVVAVALFWADVVRRLWLNLVPTALHDWPQRLKRYSAGLAMGACALVGFLHYAVAKDSLPQHPLVETARISSISNDAYRRNLPILQLRAKPSEIEDRRVRSLKAVYGIYLDDTQIATSDLAKGGRLPPILQAVRYAKRYAYLLHDAQAYRGHNLEEWLERGCALVVTEEKNHLNAAAGVPSLILENSEKLPDSCRPPEPQP